MKKLENNYAFIDSQNLYLALKELGWKLDYNKFRVFLKEKYSVQKAYVFVGFVASNQQLYDTMVNAGFALLFKPTSPDFQGKVRGNIDADMVLEAMIQLNNYEKAVIVSSDGDFYSLVRFLSKEGKLAVVLGSSFGTCSKLLTQEAKNRIEFVNDFREILDRK